MSDGITLHHDRDDLHGITVVVSGKSGRTYVGRWHERQPRGVVMRNVAILEADQDRVASLAKFAKFGIPSEHRTYVVPEDEFDRVERFG